VCLIEPTRGQLRYFAVGNVNGRVLSPSGERGLVLSAGTFGLKLLPPRTTIATLPWPPGATLVLWTDGLSSRFRSPDGALLGHHPAVVAATLHRDHARERDDATVVVVRPEPGEVSG
jgi:serine phosphatase RsbU (regulator of sigma subunit)